MHNHKHRKTQTLTIIARRTGPYSSSAFSSCYSIIQPNHVEYTRGNIQRQILDENRALLLWICSKCHIGPKSIPRSVVNWVFWKKRALLHCSHPLGIQKSCQIAKWQMTCQFLAAKLPNWPYICHSFLRCFFPFLVSCFCYRYSISLGLGSIEQWYFISTTIRMVLRHYLCHSTSRFIHEYTNRLCVFNVR